MPLLNEDQRRRATEAMAEYLSASAGADGRTPQDASRSRDALRLEVIKSQLKPLVDRYLDGSVSLDEFKRKIDSINKQNELWGFKGIKGQMFFNVLVNNSRDEGECAAEIRAAIEVPPNNEIAASRINTFCSYVRRVGDDYVSVGGDSRGKPKVGSAPYFLSYFWQIQNYSEWPVYYTNSVNMLTDLNLWLPTNENFAADYIEFKKIHEELRTLFTEKSGQTFGLYDVEHVFWTKGGNATGQDKPGTATKDSRDHKDNNKTVKLPGATRLPDSYVPPIVSILPQMALNLPELQEAAKASGTSLERAFEKHIDAALTILGFETKLLGQGGGRVPDGIAISEDAHYAIIWDAKIRNGGYSIGTDDRTIKEYITTQSRELKRRRGFRNIYYVIVSSYFPSDFDEATRTLKMDTEVNELCLVEAEALVALVEMKLRAPHSFGLGADGVQRLLCSSGIISAQSVEELLG